MVLLDPFLPLLSDCSRLALIQFSLSSITALISLSSISHPALSYILLSSSCRPVLSSNFPLRRFPSDGSAPSVSGPPRTMVDHRGPPTTIRDHRGLPRTIGDHRGPPWTTEDHRGPPGPTEDHRGPPRAAIRRIDRKFLVESRRNSIENVLLARL